MAGGWGFVAAAYGISWAGLGLYGLSLWHQTRQQAARRARDAEGEGACG